jgi:hypothetical protein
MFLPGIGGGLGLAAFVTVAILVTIKKFLRIVRSVNKSEDMTTQLPTVRSQAEGSMAKTQLERRTSTIDSSWQPAAAIVALAVFAAMIGLLMWPTRFASEEALFVASLPMSVVEEVATGPAALQAEGLSSAVDAATPLGIAEATSDSTASNQTATNEDSSKIGTDSPVELKLLSANVDERADGSEKPKTAPPVVKEVIAAREPELGDTQKTQNDVTEAALFREFLQWRAARVSGVAPNDRHNAVVSHNRLRPPAATATAAATNAPLRSRPPSSAAQATTATSPVVHPRRPHPGNTTRAAIDQAAPASAPARAVRAW